MTRRLLAGLLALAAALVLTGCSPTLSVQPAPQATSVGCAALIVRLPPTLGTVSKRQTDSQGTAAWGDPEAVQLRCGVTPPGPTTDFCETYGGVDWIRVDTGSGAATREQFTTFGRIPATQVILDPRHTTESDALPPISDAVSAAMPHATRHCTAPAAPSPGPSS